MQSTSTRHATIATATVYCLRCARGLSKNYKPLIPENHDLRGLSTEPETAQFINSLWAFYSSIKRCQQFN